VEVFDTHHIVPISTYIWVFIALMVLLVATVVAAMFDLGELNIVIALTIAVVKALLVVLFFMHVRYSSKLVQVFAASAVLWLIILFALTFSDYMSRGLFPVLGK
jgi:cytochrome c oxidase subunit 4